MYVCMLMFSIFCTEAKLSKRCTTDIHGPLSNVPSGMAARERESVLQNGSKSSHGRGFSSSAGGYIVSAERGLAQNNHHLPLLLPNTYGYKWTSHQIKSATSSHRGNGGAWCEAVFGRKTFPLTPTHQEPCLASNRGQRGRGWVKWIKYLSSIFLFTFIIISLLTFLMAVTILNYKPAIEPRQCGWASRRVAYLTISPLACSSSTYPHPIIWGDIGQSRQIIGRACSEKRPPAINSYRKILPFQNGWILKFLLSAKRTIVLRAKKSHLSQGFRFHAIG